MPCDSLAMQLVHKCPIEMHGERAGGLQEAPLRGVRFVLEKRCFSTTCGESPSGGGMPSGSLD